MLSSEDFLEKPLPFLLFEKFTQTHAKPEIFLAVQTGHDIILFFAFGITDMLMRVIFEIQIRRIHLGMRNGSDSFFKVIILEKVEVLESLRVVF